MNTKALAARLRELSEKATKADWRVSDGSIIQTNHITRDVWHIPRVEEDLHLICELRNNLPAILDAMERWERYEEAIRAAHAELEIEKDIVTSPAVRGRVRSIAADLEAALSPGAGGGEANA